jgi:hypothetical protein
MLMNAVLIRRRVMKYRDLEFQYDSEVGEPDADSVRQQQTGKQYRRKKSIRSTRGRNSKAAASQPGCGIGARRNKRWSW